MREKFFKKIQRLHKRDIGTSIGHNRKWKYINFRFKCIVQFALMYFSQLIHKERTLWHLP